jgi:hypothetical protein
VNGFRVDACYRLVVGIKSTVPASVGPGLATRKQRIVVNHGTTDSSAACAKEGRAWLVINHAFYQDQLLENQQVFCIQSRKGRKPPSDKHRIGDIATAKASERIILCVSVADAAARRKSRSISRHRFPTILPLKRILEYDLCDPRIATENRIEEMKRHAEIFGKGGFSNCRYFIPKGQ